MSKLSESEFVNIVHSVAGDMPEVLNVSIYGFEVDVTFISNSGKTSWNSFLRFDELTGKYTYTSPYTGAALPWQFGNRISSRIKIRNISESDQDVIAAYKNSGMLEAIRVYRELYNVDQKSAMKGVQNLTRFINPYDT